jgi:transposase
MDCEGIRKSLDLQIARRSLGSTSAGNGKSVLPLIQRRERLKKPRKHYTGEEKVAVLRQHLLEKEPISKLCDELGLQPTVFYRRQKESFENGATAFQAKGRSDHQAEQERIEYLEKKIQRKDEVLAELTSEHIALKKELGEL